jgi:hypothetical protein
MGGTHIVYGNPAVKKVHIGQLFHHVSQQTRVDERILTFGQKMRDRVHSKPEVVAHPGKRFKADQSCQLLPLSHANTLRPWFTQGLLQISNHLLFRNAHELMLIVFKLVVIKEMMDVAILLRIERSIR